MLEQHSTEKLGSLISEHRSAMVVPIIFFAVAGGFGLLSFAIPDNGLGYLSLILFAVAFVLWAIAFFSSQRVWMHANGFRLRKFAKQEDVLWAEVVSGQAWYSVSIKPKALIKVIFVTTDGRKITLPMEWSRRGTLTKHLGEVLPRLPEIKHYAKVPQF